MGLAPISSVTIGRSAATFAGERHLPWAIPMKHAGPRTLAKISPLLAELRARAALREKRPGVFYLKSRAFLHFHDDPAGIFADVRLADEFVRLPVTSKSEQSDMLDRIDDCLSIIESDSLARGRKRRGGRRSTGAG